LIGLASIVGVIALFALTHRSIESSSIPFVMVRDSYVQKLTWMSYLMGMLNYLIRQWRDNRKKEVTSIL
jgi:hypothetical protein